MKDKGLVSELEISYNLCSTIDQIVWLLAKQVKTELKFEPLTGTSGLLAVSQKLEINTN